MTTNDFESHVRDHTDHNLDLLYAIIGLNEESGEIAGWYKKVILRGNRIGLTDDDLKGECGDALYYLTRIILEKGWTLSQVMDFNKVKLDGRRANRFKQVV